MKERKSAQFRCVPPEVLDNGFDALLMCINVAHWQHVKNSIDETISSRNMTPNDYVIFNFGGELKVL